MIMNMHNHHEHRRDNNNESFLIIINIPPPRRNLTLSFPLSIPRPYPSFNCRVYGGLPSLGECCFAGSHGLTFAPNADPLDRTAPVLEPAPEPRTPPSVVSLEPVRLPFLLCHPLVTAPSRGSEDDGHAPLTLPHALHAHTFMLGIQKYVPLPLSGSFSLKTSVGYVPSYTLPAEHNLTCIITMLLFLFPFYPYPDHAFHSIAFVTRLYPCIHDCFSSFCLFLPP